MNIQNRYYTDNIPWLCFKHAVQRATQGEGIHTEIVDKDSYEPILMYDGLVLEQTTCQDCAAFDDHYADEFNREENDDH